MGDPEISVLIATAGGNPRLAGCLARIGRQVSAVAAELVVVFNREKSEVLADAQQCERHADRVLFEAQPGKSRALNYGVRACRGEVVAFSDDDAEPEPGWLAALTEPLLATGRDERVVGCGGPVEPIFPARTPRWYRRLVNSKPSNFLGPHHRLGGDTTEYRWEPGGPLIAPLGANCAYRREVFERYHYEPALGPNRATGIRGGEDTLLAIQLLRDGGRILYVADALVRHPVEPERIDPAFVARCFFAQGLESAWLRRRGYGRAVPEEAALRRKLARTERRVRWLRWFGPAASHRARFKREYQRGLLEEMASGTVGTQSDKP
jgi:glycosyltransferase involved in cell wall biosynthesis